MTKIQGAFIKEQGVTFAITVVLMSQDTLGTPSYWGRKDIVNFLRNVHPSRVPWKEYTFK